MNNIELNAILYYADFLSLKDIGQHVTDNCKYFFVHNTPINAAYVVGRSPIFNPANRYIQQAAKEYVTIKRQFDQDGVLSFISDIAMLRAGGMVDAERML